MDTVDYRAMSPLFVRTVAIGVLVIIIGCTQSQIGPGRVVREQSDPLVPKGESAELFEGEWTLDGALYCRIQRDANGDVRLSIPISSDWENVINNVRMSDDKLSFHCYWYYVGADDFTSISNTVGDHPFSGVRNEIVLSRVAGNSDRLAYRHKADHQASALEGVLHRRN